MTTSSARPQRLAHYATRTRRNAELLARQATLLDAAQGALLATHPDPALLPRLPDLAGDLRRLASRSFELAAFTGTVGRRFRAADTARAGARGTADSIPPRAGGASRSAARALLGDLRRAPPAERAAIVAALPDDLLTALIARDAAFVGNAAGVPPAVRFRANRHHLLADLARARAASDTAAARRLQALGGGPGAPAQLLLYDPAHGHVAQVFGDLARATDLAVFVPGCGTTFDNFSGDTARRGHNLFTQASSVAAGDVAVLAWLDYHPPSFLDGADPHPAKVGSERLAHLLGTLSGSAPAHLTLVGHSYGSFVVGRTLHKHPATRRAVDDVVVLGSPGMGVDHAADLHLHGGATVYAEDIRGDPVGHLEVFGDAPTSGSFGGVRLTTNAPGHTPIGDGLAAHSQYFVPGSEALANTALVVAGRGGEAQRQRRTTGERLADVERSTTDKLVSPGADALDTLAQNYDGPGSEAIRLADEGTNLGFAAEHTVTRYLGDHLGVLEELFPFG